jgi:hypothetical protein
MPFVPVADTAMIEVRMLYDAQKVENTLYVENLSAWSLDLLTGLANNIRDWWDGAYSPNVANSVALREIVCTDLTTEAGLQTTLGGGGLVGTGGVGGLPGNVSLAVSFHTGLRGRNFRGRNYVVGIPEGFRSGISGVTPDYGALWVASYTGLIAAALAPDQTWVVVSRFSGISGTPPRPTPRAAGVTTPVTSVVVTDLGLDSQRNRLPGRGQ